VLAKQLAEEKRKEAELEKNLANTKAELLKDEANLAEVCSCVLGCVYADCGLMCV
jgi:hypothetical protein